ncbi:hypothetical protein, partial [Ralstonia pseudosolanacearum]|uniref:hypothetical protein n=2 Tax=Ralstonia pseudosolanacearum TaxID=1310165 RepID=UPI003CF7EBCB
QTRAPAPDDGVVHHGPRAPGGARRRPGKDPRMTCRRHGPGHRPAITIRPDAAFDAPGAQRSNGTDA